MARGNPDSRDFTDSAIDRAYPTETHLTAQSVAGTVGLTNPTTHHEYP